MLDTIRAKVNAMSKMAFLTPCSRPFAQVRLYRLVTVGRPFRPVEVHHRPGSFTRCMMTAPAGAGEGNNIKEGVSERYEDRMFASNSSFAELGVSPDIVACLAGHSITTPTNVQASVIPLMLRGLERQIEYASQVRAADEGDIKLPTIQEESMSAVHAEVQNMAQTGAGNTDTNFGATKRPRPPADDDDDVLMVGAETGSGKTLAYLLPYVEAARTATDVNLKAIVLVPSRELCWQIADFMKSYFPSAPRHLVLAGGQPPDASDVRAVRVILATPTALLNYFRFSEKPDTSDKVIVVDEADMLLTGSFLRDVERILDQPGMKPFATRRNSRVRAINRNRLLFVGATYPHWTGEKVRSIITWMRRRYPNVKAVQTEGIHKRSVRLQSRWRLVKTEVERIRALIQLIETEMASDDKVMVFTSKADTSQRVCESVVSHVGGDRIVEKFGSAVQLHKFVPADERRSNLERFRNRQARLLFCTDLGARGLDLGNVTWVVEFDFSTNVVGYLHRIGRTARAGASGRTEHFYDEVSEPLAKAIRERAEKESTVVEGVFSRNRSFRKKLKKQGAVTDLKDVVIDEIDIEEEERLRGD